MQYPGDTAAPEAVAKYFYHVARSYKLPGILPVMTSYVELTNAWLAAGDVKGVVGYLYPVDHWSVGYFQQQYDGNPDGTYFGWGTYEQLIDAEYAVHRFCQEAVKFMDYEWHDGATDPDVLGRWCQAVQRSAVPDAYRDKGYPAAVELLEGVEDDEEEVADHDTLAFDSGQWGINKATGKWMMAEGLGPNDTLKVNRNNWVWVKREVIVPEFTWPVANTPAIPGSAWYGERHPTRYNWRPDVEEWARYLVQTYNVWCNTYVEHPEGWGWDVASVDADGTTWYVENTSLDVWGPAGRDDWLDANVGQTIFNLLFYYKGLPNINWIIYNRTIYMASNDWYGQPFGDGTQFTNHEDHIHVTYH